MGGDRNFEQDTPPNFPPFHVFDTIITEDFLRTEFKKASSFSFKSEASIDARVYQASSYCEGGKIVLSSHIS